jgi:hypothetical protein
MPGDRADTPDRACPPGAWKCHHASLSGFFEFYQPRNPE